MKKIFLLPLCVSCICGISACSTNQYNQDEIFIEDEQVSAIDATVQADKRCGVDGISCNDDALINYTRTEADYREYGERTRRDNLYTQEAAGNNLTAAIRPSIEDDIVVAYNYNHNRNTTQIPVKQDDGAFEKTAPVDIEIAQDYKPVTPSSDQIGQKNNIKPNLDKYAYEVVCEDGTCTDGEPIYKRICEDECDDDNNNDEVISSEFTEESFDIADYISEDAESEGSEISFTETGKKEEFADNNNANNTKISDTTILTWEAEEGDNLRDLLTKWSAMSGWKLLWQTNRNYILSAGVMFKGKFTDVSSALVRAFARARPAPIATYYKGNRVIVVETMENENAY